MIVHTTELRTGNFNSATPMETFATLNRAEQSTGHMGHHSQPSRAILRVKRLRCSEVRLLLEQIAGPASQGRGALAASRNGGPILAPSDRRRDCATRPPSQARSGTPAASDTIPYEGPLQPGRAAAAARRRP